MDDDEITLEIEDTSIKCSKKLLSSHSDYFRIMFEGAFIERNKSVIKLHDVELKSMNLILQLLWDYTYFIDDEDILLVLHTACILQFAHVKYVCIERITEKLNHENCLKIWLTTEQLDILPLYLKAKNLALTEFNLIKDMECMLDLTIYQLKSYLSNMHLKCACEMDVFQAGMRWYYENENKVENMDRKSVLFEILNCLSYNMLGDGDVHEILAYPDISAQSEIVDTLNCLLDLRHKNDTSSYASNVIERSTLFSQTKKRLQPKLLCLFVNYFATDAFDTCLNTKLTVYTTDAYKRRRIAYVIAGGKSASKEDANAPTPEQNLKHLKSVKYYDEQNEKIVNFFGVPDDKCRNLIGYSIIGYKEFIFLFGGEMCIGRGKWNYNVWAYDTIRENWERKTKMPYGRRHFECCIANDTLFIIGGTGNFRVLQENMVYYSYKEDKWSKEVVLPCRSLQVKCCEFKNQLFLLSINEKSAYLYNMSTSQWVTYKVPENALNSIISEKFSLFSYEDHVYIKGSKLVQMNCLGSNMNVVSIRDANIANYDKLQSVLCNNILYTLYKNVMDNHEVTNTLEMFNMDSLECGYLFENKSSNDTLEMDGHYYKYNSITRLFTFQHHNLLLNDTQI